MPRASALQRVLTRTGKFCELILEIGKIQGRFSVLRIFLVAFKGEFPLAYSLLPAYLNSTLTVVLSDVEIESASSHFILRLGSKRHRMPRRRRSGLARDHGRRTAAPSRR